MYSAYYSYVAYTPKNHYSGEYPNLVRDVRAPDVTADNVEIFCGNIQKSKMPELEDCAIWGAQVRFGQYVIYIEAFDLGVDLQWFKELVSTTVNHAQAALA